MKKILFLDIDGVIATPKSLVAYGYDEYLFDPCSCRLIYLLCKEENMKIVIHSTWRYIPDGFQKFRSKLAKACPELLEFLYPEISGKHKTIGNGYIPKTESIDMWLDRYIDEEQVEDFLIIDDEKLDFSGREHLEPHFHQVVHGNEGFGYSDYLHSKAVLRQDAESCDLDFLARSE